MIACPDMLSRDEGVQAKLSQSNRDLTIVARQISKLIRDSKLKAQAQIQGDQLRVSSKVKDQLQAVMQMMKGQDLGIDLQFVNYR